jgi:hypothetical protein
MCFQALFKYLSLVIVLTFGFNLRILPWKETFFCSLVELDSNSNGTLITFNYTAIELVENDCYK